MKSRLPLCLVLILFNYLVQGQNTSSASNSEFDFEIPLAEDILLQNNVPTKVMMLGTWHFKYYNLDTHKIEEENKVDFTTEKRQDEIRQVINKLKEFNPTIVCIERGNQTKLDSLYGAYKAGTHKLTVDEEQQIGFRVANEVGLHEVRGIDSDSWLHNNYEAIDSNLVDFWKEESYLDTLVSNEWNKKYEKWYSQTDKFPKTYTIGQVLKIYNHPKNLKLSLGHYLVGMGTKDDSGADAFSMGWYDRNVRIFNNVLKLNAKAEDRILIIYGAGHIPILEQLFDVSPQFELVRPFNYSEN